MFTHKAGAVLAERGLDISGLGESVDEAHLAVEQRAGLHKVVYHLFSADLPIPARGSKSWWWGREGAHMQVHSINSIAFTTVYKSARRSLVLVQLSKLAEVWEVVSDGLKLIPGDVAITVCVEVLENRL